MRSFFFGQLSLSDFDFDLNQGWFESRYSIQILFFRTQIITSMKHTHLSNFQKQQYTAYLESQLQKFSAFMLSQRKENEKYKALEQAVSSHANLIDQLQSKYQMTDFYCHENVTNIEHLAKKCEKMQDLESRVRRLEDRERFDCDRQARKKYQLSKKQAKTERQYDQREKAVEISINELSKKLKKIEQEISKNKDNYLPKFGNPENQQTVAAVQEITEKRVKKLEKKMKKYFANRFEQIEILVKHSKKHKSKSPIARTPVEMSTMSHYEVDVLEKPLSQFKLRDHSINKSQISTILRSSNTTASNKHKSKVSSSKGKEKVRREKQQSRSKSKTKEKESKKKLKRSKSKSVSRSKSRKLDHSMSYSDNSYLKSSVSRSKSKSRIQNNQSLDIKKKRSIKRKDKREDYASRSKSKSNRSEISMHERCKKRPEFQTALANQRREKDTKKQEKKQKRKVNK